MPQAPGGIELHDLQVEVIAPVVETPPVSLNKRKITANLSTLLDNAAVTNRHPARRAIFRLGAGVMAGSPSALPAQGFTETPTPANVASATESGADASTQNY